ncbi:pimeloyl-ACP methyl ester carboxylesterase [Diaminobutyricimonas aerilata]|uniref:Pimeloyl-ACP methyl ester carboxylesterase n=1 Tax=Diaminobutyricimonas aerilata TaxID=1162967 RepID=A0A2M9CNL0_9MICO|nr:epoxide hydrolase family protein [Diaminobutyricimonas aerilata]PJJ73495.1 pimeloyl-ACP methyl ester carboxylesterase [Diaminobutyricimonas aerilata]
MSTPTPFSIAIPDSDLDGLHRRLEQTRWSDPVVDADDGSRGISAARLRHLADRWRSEFDWRTREAQLNSLPQFTADLPGQRVHFVHARSEHPDARPLLLLHGWPSTFAEYERVIRPLTAPAAGEPAFHVVAPSLPGFGFSPHVGPGTGDLGRVAGVMVALMDELGYGSYLVHGTDVGAGVAGVLEFVGAGRVAGVHVAGPSPFPLAPAPELPDASEADRRRLDRFTEWQQNGLGYLQLQSTRPSTIGYALVDSPIAQLAWIAEKFDEWSGDGVDDDVILTTASLYWFTGTGATAAHVTFDGMQAFRAFAASGQSAPPAHFVPNGVAVFGADHTVRALVDPQHALPHWSEFDTGGHFPAIEVPELLVGDLRSFARLIDGR